MVIDQIKKKILSTLTIGIASWMIAIEGLKIINQYVPENSLILKGTVVVVLYFIGFQFFNN